MSASVTSLIEHIHSRAVALSIQYKRTEGELVEILQQAEDNAVYLHREHSSLFAYATDELGLGEHTALNLIAVARAARSVPRLKAELQAGRLTLSNARRIAPVLTPDNQEEWIHKACALSNRQLEKELVKVRPREATRERVSYVSEERVQVELGLSERELLKLRRVQDLLSQSKQRPVSLEECIEAITAEFLRRKDPLERAKRRRVRGRDGRSGAGPSETVDKLVTPTSREPIPARVLHQVNWRDRRRCAYTFGDGRRCNQTRWVEIHHRIPVSEGGTNTVDNLVTLCSTHHRWVHKQEPQEGT